MRRWGLFSGIAVNLVLSASIGFAQEGNGSAARQYPDGSEKYAKDPGAGSPGTAVQGPQEAARPFAPIDPIPMPAAAPLGKMAAAAAAIAIDVKPAAAAVDLYRPLFATITMAVNYANPYDQNDVKVDLVATSPSGKTIVQPCFFKSGTTAASVWEARWTPRETGDFTYRISVLKSGETSLSAAQSLTVNPSNLDGFLHMDTTGSFYQFRFDSGKPWRGVGENFGWESGKYTFEVMFALLKQNGANFVRTWKGPGNFYLEQGTGKAGWYQQDTANRLDKVLNLAEQSGIYLMPTLDPVIEYQTGVDGWSGEIKWQKNPYGTYKGGPCNGPIDFFNGAKARDIYKNRLRYAVARWGYSPYMAVYEFFNEVDWANITEHVPAADLGNWHNYMASYLRSIDPYNHLVTTSLSHSDFPEIWSLKNMDFTQRHLYGSTDQFITFLDSYSKNYKKPFVSGEFSFDWQGVTQHPHDQYAKELHLGLWRGMFSATPILPLTWWWDFHADNNDYFHFARARDFMDKMTADTKGVSSLATESVANVEARAIKSDRGVFVWLYNKGGAATNNYQVKVTGVANVAYDWKSFDTWKGGYGNAAGVTATGGVLTVTAPALAAGADMAIWFADKTPSVTAARNVLPGEWSAAFDAGSGRLNLVNGSATGEKVGYALVDMAGKTRVTGAVEVAGNGRAAVDLVSGERKAGVYALRISMGNLKVTRRVVLSAR
ncbi:MAG: hypothetical protein JWO30_5002 [Fibrobacteres bacterium]|nr:hypothetical protein [Fibrobacterota bacterium]